MISLLAGFTATSVLAREAVHVQYFDGASLYEFCTSPNPAKRAGCIGYLQDIVDAGDNQLAGSTCVPLGTIGD
jgi:hypothetical protein